MTQTYINKSALISPLALKTSQNPVGIIAFTNSMFPFTLSGEVVLNTTLFIPGILSEN